MSGSTTDTRKYELENTYEFKVIRKMLMRTYPWIKDFSVDSVGKYHIFVKIKMNPYELAVEKDWKIQHYYKTRLINGESIVSSYFQVIYVIPYEEGKDLVSEIEDSMNSVRKSMALPEELKFPGNYDYDIHVLETIPNSIPKDADIEKYFAERNI